MIDLNPNETLPILWLIFMVVLVALNLLVFKPTLKLIDERKNRTDLLKDDSSRLLGETKSLMTGYEQKMKEARLNAAKAREHVLEEAHKEESVLVSKARKEAEVMLASMRKDLAADCAEATESLKKYAVELSRDMVNKVLERKKVA